MRSLSIALSCAVLIAAVACNDPRLVGKGACSGATASSGQAASAPTPGSPADAAGLIAAMDVPGPVTNATLTDVPNQAAAFASLGTLQPTKGPTFAFLSTGVAGAGTPQTLDPYATSTQDAESMNGQPCDFDPFSFDCVTLTFSVVAPSDAHSLAFDFNFLSSEYPEFVGSNFNDTFLVSESSPSYSWNNIVYDAQGHVIDVNNVFFVEPCNQLGGTGYDIYEQGAPTTCDAGATGLLTTSSPVQGGETVTMSFVIYDESDPYLDSAVMIDDFRFDGTTVTTPTTSPTATPTPALPCPPQ